jgi:hypothetical protein
VPQGNPAEGAKSALAMEQLAIHDLEVLQRLAGFSPDYLFPFERPASPQPAPRTLNGDLTEQRVSSNYA